MFKCHAFFIKCIYVNICLFVCMISYCVVGTGMFITPEKSGVQWFNAASSENSSEFHLIGMVTEIIGSCIRFMHT